MYCMFQVVNAWSRVKFPQLLGKENIFVSTHEAMIQAKVRTMVQTTGVGFVRACLPMFGLIV